MTLTQERAQHAVEAITTMQRRVIQDALLEASSDYWTRRAAQFEAARPQASDMHGTATRDVLRARDQQLAAVAQACRNAALLCDLADDETRLLDALLESEA